MAEAPTIVFVVGAAAESQPGAVAEKKIVDGEIDLEAVLLAILDGTVAEPARVRDALLLASPLCVVVATAQSAASDGVPLVDEAALAPLLALASASAHRSRAERAALNELGAGYTLLGADGRRLVSSAPPASVGLRSDGRPTGVLDDDQPDTVDTPSRRLRIGTTAGDRVVERRVVESMAAEGRLVLHVDVTERAELEGQVLASGRAAASSQLARGVVHDLNNAFCVIASFTDLLLEELDPDAPSHEDVLEIARAGSRASALMAKLVGFSRGGPSRIDTVNIADAVRRAEPLMRRVLGEESELALALTATDVTAVCDMLELESVVTGLVSRARRTLSGRTGVVTVAVTDEPPWVKLQVNAATADDGLPTSAEPGGSVERDAATAFASRFGGRFESEALLLPKAAKRPPAQRIPRARTTERGPETVLVIDDEASVRLAVKRVLTSLGYRVLEARHGGDAASLVADCDVVIADLVLPGERGVDVVRAFRSTRPGLPALIVTGYAEEDAISSSGFTVMRKPFDAAELARRVRQTIDGR